MPIGYCKICNRYCDDGHVHWGNVFCLEKPRDVMHKGKVAIHWIYSVACKKWVGLNHLDNRVR